MACLIINIHRGALLITFLISSMHGALGENVGSGRAVAPWLGHLPVPNPSLAMVLKQSVKLQPQRLIFTGMARSCSVMGHPTTPVQPKARCPPVSWHGHTEAVCLCVPACAGSASLALRLELSPILG